MERQFYEKACISERWSVRDFKRQKESGLFLRLAASRDKEGIMKLAGAGLTYDNPPIGIILSREKDELMVEYATYGMDQNLFVSKYELYLPDKDQLRALIAETFSKQANEY